MKAITLYQPWAQAVALGFKPVETRSWKTKYRGPLAIHASSTFAVKHKNLIYTNPAMRQKFVLAGWVDPGKFPLGAIIAYGVLDDCMSAEEFKLLNPISYEMQKNWGDFSSGRFAWILKDILKLIMPIPAKGKLGLWEWQRTKLSDGQ